MQGEVVIHIVDDEEAVRKSLAFLLTAAGHAVRVHESAADFLALAGQLGNACLLTDVRMPDMSGIELLHRLGETGAMLPTIVVTGHGDVPMAVQAMKAGAIDFIEKPFEDSVLLEAVGKAVAKIGNSSHAGNDASGAVRARIDLLTERERQVLIGLVKGLPNKSIAFDLEISPRTVEVHRAHLMAKMQAKNLPELVRMALSANIEL
ncbi:MAG: response regulator [Nitratireductor sp.]|nr:response regulator [Nitratireductor sp.]